MMTLYTCSGHCSRPYAACFISRTHTQRCEVAGNFWSGIGVAADLYDIMATSLHPGLWKGHKAFARQRVVGGATCGSLLFFGGGLALSSISPGAAVVLETRLMYTRATGYMPR